MSPMANRTTRIDPEMFDKIAGMAKLGRDPASVRKRIEGMEQLLERMFVVPGINRPIGLDAIIGIIPIVGDTVGAVLGAWMVWEARNLGMSKFQMARMMGNVGVDFALGFVPLLGAVPDFFFRSNTRNLRIIKKHLNKHHPSTVLIEG